MVLAETRHTAGRGRGRGRGGPHARSPHARRRPPPPAREGGGGSGLGTDGRDRIQGSRDNPSSRPQFLRLLSPHLHLPPLQLPADDPARPASHQSGARAAERQFRPKPASCATSPLSSEPIEALAPPLAASPTHPRAPNGWAEEGRENRRQPRGAGEGRGARKRGSGGTMAAGGAREPVAATWKLLSPDERVYRLGPSAA